MKRIIIMLLSLSGVNSAMAYHQSTILSLPNDSFNVAVVASFTSGDLYCCHPLISSGISYHNDTMVLSLFYETNLCSGLVCAEFDTLSLGQVTPSMASYLEVKGSYVLEFGPGTWDTMAYAHYFKPFPWTNSMTEITTSEAIYLSPNPVKNTVSVSFTTKQQGTMDIRVMDVNGQLLISQQQKIAAASLSVSVDHLPPGVYYLMVSDKKQRRYRGSFVKVN